MIHEEEEVLMKCKVLGYLKTRKLQEWGILPFNKATSPTLQSSLLQLEQRCRVLKKQNQESTEAIVLFQARHTCQGQVLSEIICYTLQNGQMYFGAHKFNPGALKKKKNVAIEKKI